MDKILKFSEKQKKAFKPREKRSQKPNKENPNLQDINPNNIQAPFTHFPISLTENLLSMQAEGSNSNFLNYNLNGNLDMQRNNKNLSLSRNGSNYFNNNYFALNMMKAESGKSFASSINEQNNNSQME